MHHTYHAIVTERNAQPVIPNLIEGGAGYDQFDSNLYAYQTEAPEAAKESVMRYAGRMPQEIPQGGEEIPAETTVITTAVTEATSSVTTTTTTVTEPEILRGDVNLDGVFDYADAVLLQKWLLGVSDITLSNWENGDYNMDEQLDARDLTLMKRALMQQNSIE